MQRTNVVLYGFKKKKEANPLPEFPNAAFG